MDAEQILFLGDALEQLDILRQACITTELNFTFEAGFDATSVEQAMSRTSVGLVLAERVTQDLFDVALRHAGSVPTMMLCATPTPQLEREWRQAGVLEIVDPANLALLSAALRHLATKLSFGRRDQECVRRGALVDVVQQLSSTRSMDDIMGVTRHAIREVMGAEGAAFILRDGDFCHYADEDAILPLWKGQRFPMTGCIGGNSMLSRGPVVIEDVLQDDRAPRQIYEPTFVRSLVVVPIRTAEPIGAIGAYWSRTRKIPAAEVALLQALANATSLAIQNVRMQDELEQRVSDRTKELQQANEELDAFASSVSHDLRNKLNCVHGYTSLLELQTAGKLDTDAARCLGTIKSSAALMLETISDLLALSRAARQELNVNEIDLTALVKALVADIQRDGHYPNTKVTIAEGMTALADAGLMRTALDNILSNAFKYSSKAAFPAVHVGQVPPDMEENHIQLFVRDNGAGFDPARGPALFKPFARLHNEMEFPGTGIGLTIVRRAVDRCGGDVRIDGALGQGATVYLRLRRASRAA